jgi:hypothetical protein
MRVANSLRGAFGLLFFCGDDPKIWWLSFAALLMPLKTYKHELASDIVKVV